MIIAYKKKQCQVIEYTMQYDIRINTKEIENNWEICEPNSADVDKALIHQRLMPSSLKSKP